MESDDFLRERAESAAEELVRNDKEIEIDKQNEFDEALESDLNTDEGVWSHEEVEYLVNNRKKMGNDELKEFLQRNSDFQKGGFERFSETEERAIIRGFPEKDADELAEELDKNVESVEKKIKMLGLARELSIDG